MRHKLIFVNILLYKIVLIDRLTALLLLETKRCCLPMPHPVMTKQYCPAFATHVTSDFNWKVVE